MRVLWFTNNASVGDNHLNRKGIGAAWILSLESELTKVPNVQLGISFTYNQPAVSQFNIGNTRYYPIRIVPVKNKFKQIFNRITHRIENENIIQQYLDIIQQFKPDIIHIFGSENNFGLMISKTSVPCIIHLQGILTVINIKWFSGLSSTDIFKFSKKWFLMKGYGIYHDYFVNKKASEREKRIFKTCKYFMGRTDWDRRLTSILSPVSKYFLCDEIMRPGFYLHRWSPPTNQPDYKIISTIRKNIYKGLETILECEKILKQNFPDYKIHWGIAGINNEDEISYLVENKCRAKFKDFDIQLLGPLNEDELIKEMLSANLFVHSSHIDNSPNSVCEAMLLGMPVIASSVGGTPSIITDNKDGILVQDGDPYALAGAIRELLKDKTFAISLGANARVRAMKRNDPSRIVNDVVNIYSSILTEK